MSSEGDIYTWGHRVVTPRRVQLAGKQRAKAEVTSHAPLHRLRCYVSETHCEEKMQNTFNGQQSTLLTCKSMRPVACEGVFAPHVWCFCRLPSSAHCSGTPSAFQLPLICVLAVRTAV